jgi:preprotein translocase subunit Sss1
MKRFALLPALFALLLAAVLTGAAFAQQAPPGPTSPQAGDMIPDAASIAAFAARSSTEAHTPQAGDMIPDVIAAGLTIPTDLATAQSPTWEEYTSKAEAQWQIAQRQAYGLAQGTQIAQAGLTTAQSPTWEEYASKAEAQWQLAQRQAAIPNMTN